MLRTAEVISSADRTEKERGKLRGHEWDFNESTHLW